MNNQIIINSELSHKVVMVGVTYRTDKPNGGGVSAVVETYNRFFEDLRYIPTWKQTNKMGKALYFLLNYMKLFALLCFDWRIRIVHIHAASDASFERKMLIFNLAKTFKKKVILHMHAGEFDRYYQNSSRKKQIKRTILACDKLIALSPSWRNYYIKFGKNKEDVILLNNIVSIPFHKKLYAEKVHLLYLGWLGDKKGVFDLIDVVVKHKDELRGKFFLRLGGFDNYEKIKAIIEKNVLNDVMSLEGWVSGDKKTQCLDWANLFILPSYYEGLPISILEAMSYGMPIISTPVGGIPEIVKNRVNGIMVEPGNKDQIWKAIKTFIDNPQLLEEYGKESLRLVEPYTPESVLGHLRNIYEELLKEK